MEDGVNVNFPELVVPPVVEMVVSTYAPWREQGPPPVERMPERLDLVFQQKICALKKMDGETDGAILWAYRERFGAPVPGNPAMRTPNPATIHRLAQKIREEISRDSTI